MTGAAVMPQWGTIYQGIGIAFEMMSAGIEFFQYNVEQIQQYPELQDTEEWGNIQENLHELNRILAAFTLSVLPPLLEGVKGLIESFSVLAPLIAGIGGAFAVFKTAANWGLISGKIGTIVTAVENLGQTLSLGIGVMGGSAAASASAAQTFGPGILATPAAWAAMLGIVAIGTLYTGVAAYNKKTGSSVSATGIIVGMFQGIWAVIQNVIKRIWNAISMVFELLGNSLLGHWEHAKDMLTVNMVEYFPEVTRFAADILDKLTGSDLSSKVDMIEEFLSEIKDNLEISKSEGYETGFFFDYVDVSAAYSSGYDAGAGFAAEHDPFRYLNLDLQMEMPEVQAPTLPEGDLSHIQQEVGQSWQETYVSADMQTLQVMQLQAQTLELAQPLEVQVQMPDWSRMMWNVTLETMQVRTEQLQAQTLELAQLPEVQVQMPDWSEMEWNVTLETMQVRTEQLQVMQPELGKAAEKDGRFPNLSVLTINTVEKMKTYRDKLWLMNENRQLTIPEMPKFAGVNQFAAEENAAYYGETGELVCRLDDETTNLLRQVLVRIPEENITNHYHNDMTVHNTMYVREEADVNKIMRKMLDQLWEAADSGSDRVSIRFGR